MAMVCCFREHPMKPTSASHKPVTSSTIPDDQKKAPSGSGGKSGKPGEMEVFGAQRKPVLPPRLYPLASPRHPTTAPDRSAWIGGGSTAQVLAGMSPGLRKGRPISPGDPPPPKGTPVTGDKDVSWLPGGRSEEIDHRSVSWLIAGRTAEMLIDAVNLDDEGVAIHKVFGLHYSFEPSRYSKDLPHLGRPDDKGTSMTMLLGGNQGYIDGTFTQLYLVESGPDNVLAAIMARDAADISDDEIMFMQKADKRDVSPPGYLRLLQGMPDEPGLRKLLTASLALPDSLLDIVADYLTQPKTPHTAEGWRKLGLNDIVPVNGLLVMVCGRPKEQEGVTALDVFYPRTEGTLQDSPVTWNSKMMRTGFQRVTTFFTHISPALPHEPALLREHVGKEPPRLAGTRGDSEGYLKFRGHIYTIKLPDASQYPKEAPLPQKAPEGPAPGALTSWNPLAHWRKPAAIKPALAAPTGGLTTTWLALRNDRPEVERQVRVTDASGVTRTGTLQPVAEDGEVWVTFNEADFNRKDRADSGIRWARTTTAGINSCLLELDRFKIEWANP